MANRFNLTGKVVFNTQEAVTLPKSATAPANPVAGDMYFNTTLNQVQIYKEGSWQDVAVGNVSLTGQVLNENEIIVGNASGESANVDTDTTGDVRASSDQGLIVKDGVIDNANIASGAAISRSKLASGSAYRLVGNNQAGELTDMLALDSNRVLVTNIDGLPTTSIVTIAEVDHLSGVTSPIQTQINNIASSVDFSPYLRHDGSVGLTGDIVPESVYGANLGSTAKPFGYLFAAGWKDGLGASRVDLGGARDGFSTQSIDWNLRLLTNTTNFTTVDWNASTLVDATYIPGSASIIWDARVLKDMAGVTALDWSGADNDNKSRKLLNVLTPTSETDAANKAYVDSSIEAAVDFSPYLKHNGSVAITGNLVPAGANNTNLGSNDLPFLVAHLTEIQLYSGPNGSIGSIGDNAGGLQIIAGGINSDLALVPNGTGSVDVSNKKIKNLAAPVNATDAARKIDVENAITGLDFQKDIDAKQIDATLNPSLITGSRYVITNLGALHANFGTIASLGVNDIVEYNGTAFIVAYDVSVQGEGALVWDKNTNVYLRYNETSWDEFGGLAGVTAGVGLVKTGNVIDVNLGAGISQLPSDEVGVDLYITSGLMLTENGSAGSTNSAAQLSLKLDGSTISKSIDGVKVAIGGITNVEINDSANIALVKLAPTTPSMALASNASGVIVPSSVTSTELQFLSGVTSSVQTQINDKANRTISNLSGPTAVNVALLPDAQNARALGTAGKAWASTSSYVYRGPAATLATNLTTTSGSNSVTLSDVTGITANSSELFHSTAFPAGTAITAITGNVVTTTANATTTVIASAGFATFGVFVRTENETGSAPSGQTIVRSGNSATGKSGSAGLKSGDSTTGESGVAFLRSGLSSSGGVTGNVLISSGTSSNTTGLNITSGNSSGATSGAINISTGSGSVARGMVSINSKRFNVVGEGIQIVDSGGGSAALISTASYTLSASIAVPTVISTNMLVNVAQSRSQHVQYEMIHSVSGEVRTGTLMVAAGNVAAGSISLSDTNTSTSSTMDTVEFTAVMNTSTGDYNVYYVNPESVTFSIKILNKAMLVSSL